MQPTASPETARLLQDGVAAHRAGDLAAAERAYRKVLKKNPREPDALHLLGLVLSQAGNAGDGAAAIKAALAARDDFPDAHLNLGIILAKLGNNAEAERHFQRAAQLRPSAPAPHLELARIKRFGNDPQDLFTAVAAALRVAPDNALLHVMAAEALFAQSRLREAWREYRFRFQSAENSVQGKNYPLPVWQGEALTGRAILIWTEQAPGDEIMYANMLPDTIAAAGRCAVQCSPRLAPLFRRSFPGAEIFDRDLTPDELRGIDFQSPVGNLGEWLRPEIAAFPAHAGYLRPDPDLRDRLRAKYTAAANGKLIVGVSWRSAAPVNGADKSLNILDWGPVFHVPGVVFVNLQYGRTEAEREAVRKGFGVEILNDETIDSLKDMDGYAAQVAAMDLVVTSSNTAAHVAGALGIPTLCLLPASLALGRRWYWFAQHQPCPWYPAMRLLVRNPADNWLSVIREAGVAVLDLAAARGADAPGYLRAMTKAFIKIGRPADAVALLQRLAQEPGHAAEAFYQIAEIHLATQNPDAALAAAEQAIAADPGYWHAHNAKGRIFNVMRRFEDAATAFQEGLRHTDAVEIRANLGKALATLGHKDSALRELKQAFAGSRAAAPVTRDAIALNYASALKDAGDTEAAIAVFRELVAAAPEMVDAHYNLGFALLSLGRFEEGWKEFAWRLKRPNMAKYVFPAPKWAGQDIAGKKVLVWTEQGLGDEIMVASLVPDVLAKAKDVVFLCSERLVPVMRRSFPTARVEERKEPLPKAATAPDIACQMSLSDLGAAFRRGFADFPARGAFLKADDTRRRALRARYAAGRATVLVGLSWSSRQNPEVGWLKSTDLADWAPILNTPGVTFVNLQYGDWASTLADVRARTGVEIVSDPEVDPLRDMDAFCAQVAAMDLVISVSNTTVHVAGALGIPTWVMAAEGRGRMWYWFRDRSDSPWYASVRLIEGAPGDDGWPPRIARCARDLQDWTRTRTPT
ncbi:MAG: tetratricopeptide repeat protein [Rhodospirillaceae bacterium]|nr:tetratricopeptide repeat protein [Rhodospirillaceae bacterium]